MGLVYYVDPHPGGQTCGAFPTGANNCPFTSITEATNTIVAPGTNARVTLELASATYGAAETAESFPIVIREYIDVRAANPNLTRDAYTIDVDGGGPIGVTDGGTLQVGIALHGTITDGTLVDASKSAAIIAVNTSGYPPEVSKSIIVGGQWGIVVSATDDGRGIPGMTISDCDISAASADGIFVTTSPNGHYAPTVTVEGDAVGATAVHNNAVDGILVNGRKGSSSALVDPMVTVEVGACVSGGTPGEVAIYCNAHIGLEDTGFAAGDYINADEVSWENAAPTVSGTLVVGGSGVDISDTTVIQATGCPAAPTDSSTCGSAVVVGHLDGR